MKKLKLAFVTMTLLFSMTASALADGVLISNVSNKNGVLISNKPNDDGVVISDNSNKDGVLISNTTTEGEMGFPKSESTITSSIIEAILGLF